MNKTVSQFGDMPWVNILMIGLVTAAFYYFVLFNDGTAVNESIKTTTTELNEAETQLQKMEKDLENTNRFEREVQDTVKQFDRIIGIMPETMDSAELQTIVNQKVGLAGIRSKQIEPKKPDERKGFYEITRVQMSLEGTFAQLVSFLSYISGVPKLLTFDSVEITAQATDSSEVPKLQFSGTLAGYRYVKTQAVDSKIGSEPAVGVEAPAKGGTSEAH